MSLQVGQRVGSYEITALLGKGGMGEVYRARDTRLGRDVAIKILARQFTDHSDQLTRFEREARVLASLNHPNIGAIYGVEESKGGRALVLELVEGDTLAQKISGRISIDQILSIARQIADALDVAHEKGIVHRDLKPANIKITPGGVVKVLDFGLAKLAMPSGSASPGVNADTIETLTALGATEHGVILGTVAYMSPEQARGQTVDKRTDIWAFGCVLYEMLVGRAAFAGETTTDILAAIVGSGPDWSALPSSTPAVIQRLLRRCLTKHPKERLRDIGDARNRNRRSSNRCDNDSASSADFSLAVVNCKRGCSRGHCRPRSGLVNPTQTKQCCASVYTHHSPHERSGEGSRSGYLARWKVGRLHFERGWTERYLGQIRGRRRSEFNRSDESFNLRNDGYWWTGHLTRWHTHRRYGETSKQ
jgi:serine/threonine protein kinase